MAVGGKALQPLNHTALQRATKQKWPVTGFSSGRHFSSNTRHVTHHTLYILKPQKSGTAIALHDKISIT
jgi:hypothetical protein